MFSNIKGLISLARTVIRTREQNSIAWKMYTARRHETYTSVLSFPGRLLLCQPAGAKQLYCGNSHCTAGAASYGLVGSSTRSGRSNLHFGGGDSWQQTGAGAGTGEHPGWPRVLLQHPVGQTDSALR